MILSIRIFFPVNNCDYDSYLVSVAKKNVFESTRLRMSHQTNHLNIVIITSRNMYKTNLISTIPIFICYHTNASLERFQINLYLNSQQAVSLS